MCFFVTIFSQLPITSFSICFLYVAEILAFTTLAALSALAET